MAYSLLIGDSFTIQSGVFFSFKPSILLWSLVMPEFWISQGQTMQVLNKSIIKVKQNPKTTFPSQKISL